MKSYNNYGTSKHFNILLIVLLSLLHFKQAFAVLIEQTYRNDNITVILTGDSLFATNECTRYSSHYLNERFVALVTSREKDKNKSLKMIATPCPGKVCRDRLDLDFTFSRLDAMKRLAFSLDAQPDLNNKDSWDRYPEDSELDKDERGLPRYDVMPPNYCYVQKAETRSRFVTKFQDNNIYMSFINTLYDINVDDESDEKSIKDNLKIIQEGLAYSDIINGLQCILKKNVELSECHIILPIFNRDPYKTAPKETVTAFLDKFLHDIKNKLNLPTTFYVDLYRHSDKMVNQIDKFLKSEGYAMTPKSTK